MEKTHDSKFKRTINLTYKKNKKNQKQRLGNLRTRSAVEPYLSLQFGTDRCEAAARNGSSSPYGE